MCLAKGIAIPVFYTLVKQTQRNATQRNAVEICDTYFFFKKKLNLPQHLVDTNAHSK